MYKTFITKSIIFILAITLSVVTSSCSKKQTVRSSNSGKVNPVRVMHKIFSRQDPENMSFINLSREKVYLNDYKGKVVVLNLFTTWCMPCLIEIPYFMDLTKKYQNSPFKMIGISLDNEPYKFLPPFIAKAGINYSIFVANENLKTGDSALGTIPAIPATYIFDKKGRLAFIHNGIVFPEEFENVIIEMLNE